MAKRHIDYYLDIINKKSGSGGGGQSVTVEQLNVSANGTYTAQSGHAYSPVVVNTPTPKTEDVLNVSANGTYTPQSGHTYSEVNVNTPVPKTEDTLTAAANGTYTPESGHVYSEVNVNVPSSGGAVDETKPVKLIDYDGTVLHSYTAEEFAALNALPDNPVHAGLTAQGWNWTLEDAKAYVAKYGRNVIGQNYITSDGKTRIYIHIESFIADGVTLSLYSSSTSVLAQVDWGDGSAHDNFYNSISHTYATDGDFVIEINAPTEMKEIHTYSGANSMAATIVRAIEVGNNVRLGEITYSKQLESITTPADLSVMGLQLISCLQLKGFVYPRNNNNSSVQAGYFYGNVTLKYVAFNKSFSFRQGTEMFRNCYSLRELCFPETYTALPAKICAYCYGLKSVVIPDSVTAIQSEVFKGCWSLREYIGANNLGRNGGTFLASNAFDGCINLQKIHFSPTSDSASASIGSSAFNNVEGVLSVTLPDYITSIGGSAFNLLYCKEFHIKSVTPPTLSAASGITGKSGEFKIFVPAEAVDAYKSATNWSNHAGKIFADYE